jgi:thiamine pyrophosphate-dependent acetolactate synthase large subunit-like protein
MGVPGVRVDTAGDLAREVERALTIAGPHVIEALV